MSKVSRQDSYEQYNITSDWLSEFSKSLQKQSQNVDYLKEHLNKNYKPQFRTIDEKMADIKERIGFEFVNKVIDELNKTSQTIEARASCGCDSHKEAECSCKIKTAEYKHSKEDISRMSNILDYINDMIKSEPHLDPAMVISRCRDEQDLGFNKLRINMDKLKDYIEIELNSKEDNQARDLISYIPTEPETTSLREDDRADYYRHAEPEM